MSDSYILHDVMRKVKADGLFDSIRRDLITDIEQKSTYLDLKSQIESLMSSYLSEYKWSSALKKSDLREKARRHIETSNLVKETLPSLVHQYMQTCQDQLVQPRLSSFVSDHLDHVYHSIGGTHIYRPNASFTQSTSVQQEKPVQQTEIPVKKEPLPPKVPTPNVVKQKLIHKKKPLAAPAAAPIKEEKKSRVLSPLHSPDGLVDISPSPPSIENERTAGALTPSPPPPIVRVASPLRSAEISRKTKRMPENNEEKKKKVKAEEIEHEKAEDAEIDARKLRSRRPNPKYLNEQFETNDLNISEPSSPPTVSKTKKLRQSKSSSSFDTPSSPPPASATVEPSVSANDMSPEYGTSLPSPTIEKIDEQSRTPSPVTEQTKKSTSPRRLRPRKANERPSTIENQTEKPTDLPTRTLSKTRESSRHRTEQADAPSTTDDAEMESSTPKKTRHPSSSGGDNSSNELPSRSISVPDDLNPTADEAQTARISPVSAPVSKSFIWKPKISK